VDIRTKLVFTLVAVALTAMLVFGVIANQTAEDQFRDRTALQLDGLAAFKEDAVTQVVAGWIDRVGLVTSRTTLRTSLEMMMEDSLPGQSERVARAQAQGDSLTVVEVDPERAANKHVTDRNDLFADRRTELYRWE